MLKVMVIDRCDGDAYVRKTIEMMSSIKPEHELSIGAISAAEKAARNGDGPKTIEFLKSAGKWALDAATQIGSNVAAEVINKSLGL